jgi:ribosomal subunit interface protein
MPPERNSACKIRNLARRLQRAGIMQHPIQITFRGITPSPAIDARVRERAKKLERFYDRIMGCHVVLEAPHQHHRKGQIYSVTIDLTVPGGELVSESGGVDHAHEDVFVAIRDAFDALARRLEDYARRQRGEVKPRPTPPLGRPT